LAVITHGSAFETSEISSPVSTKEPLSVKNLIYSSPNSKTVASPEENTKGINLDSFDISFVLAANLVPGVLKNPP
jgi:hypothetical protein